MISVVIPVFNESSIEKCLDSVSAQKGNYEVIVVDCGSSLKKINKIKIIKTKKGRALQMNAGARKSKGDILVFLHADTILPTDSFLKIQDLIDRGYVGGGFLQRFSEGNLLLKLVSLRSNFRALVFKIFFGDQVIFVKKKVFYELNGFKRIPIMEDLDFSKRMKSIGKVAVIEDKVSTSGRKYLENGILRLTIVYFILMVMYHLKFDYLKIKKVYDWFVE